MAAVLYYKIPASGASQFLPEQDIPQARLCLLRALKPAEGNKLGQHRLTCIASYTALCSTLGKQALGGKGHSGYPGACQAVARVLTLVSWTGGGFHGSWVFKMLVLVSLVGQEIPMTGIPMQPVYQYAPDPKAGPAPPQPGFMYPPSGPAPQYPLYPAGPPIYNPAGKFTTWNPCSTHPHSPLLQDPPRTSLPGGFPSQAPSVSPWKLLGISSHGTCTP